VECLLITTATFVSLIVELRRSRKLGDSDDLNRESLANEPAVLPAEDDMPSKPTVV
jgi:hypothetical protein